MQFLLLLQLVLAQAQELNNFVSGESVGISSSVQPSPTAIAPLEEFVEAAPFASSSVQPSPTVLASLEEFVEAAPFASSSVQPSPTVLAPLEEFVEAAPMASSSVEPSATALAPLEEFAAASFTPTPTDVTLSATPFSSVPDESSSSLGASSTAAPAQLAPLNEMATASSSSLAPQVTPLKDSCGTWNGTCKDQSECNTATGSVFSGICPGAANIKCCMPDSQPPSHPRNASGVPYNSTRLALVDLNTNMLFYYEDGNLVRKWNVGTGNRRTHFTPMGEFKIYAKNPCPIYTDPNPDIPCYEQDPRNPLGRRALWFKGQYGLHGTNAPDLISNKTNPTQRRVSKGCVRSHNDNIVWLYERMQVGDSVVVVGPPDAVGPPREPCELRGGSCIDMAKCNTNTSSLITNICPGAVEIKCCRPDSQPQSNPKDATGAVITAARAAVVDLNTNMLFYYENQKLVRKWNVGTGNMKSHFTPTGNHKIYAKDPCPRLNHLDCFEKDFRNPFGPRAMWFQGQYGLVGTNSRELISNKTTPNQRRMSEGNVFSDNENILWLYDQMEVGDLVTIIPLKE